MKLSGVLSKIMRVLNVAEKNDAAKNIAAQLSRGGSRMREGFSRFNKIYEFNYNFMGQNSNMVMTSVAGHLMTYEFSSAYRGWNSCNPVDLFNAPVIKNCPKDYTNIKKTLEREIRSSDVLVIWTDCDREGENIGYEIIDTCKAVKPNVTVYRAKFSEITRQSVERAIGNLTQPNRNISDAVDVRQQLDLRIGAAFTRFQTLRLKCAFPEALADNLISYGSCQFPTLGFVVERFKAIADFISEPFWKINVTHGKDGLDVEFNWRRNRLFDQHACQVLLDVCLENPTANVINVKSKQKFKWRPKPLDTVELEKLGSRKLSINAKETMRIAERLYTQGFISYPRTETNIFPKELNLTPLVEAQCGDPSWGQFARSVVESGPNPFQGNKSDQAHPPIHPTKYTNSLNGNEKRIYELIVRHFLACLSKHAEGLETIVDVTISDEEFVATGLMIIARNYLDVYPYDKWNAKEIHIYQTGDRFRPVIEMSEGSTSPPNLLTEADLIALMEKHGIGTDATHAEHIETIKARLYVGLRDNKYFVPRTLGMGLVEGYDSMGFEMSKPNLRAELESDLKCICEGRKNANEVLAQQLVKYREVFEIAQQRVHQLDEAVGRHLQVQAQEVHQQQTQQIVTVMKCPLCRSDMYLRDRKNNEGKYISCTAYPGCKNSIWFPGMVTSVERSEQTCPTCGPDTHLLIFKFERGSCYLPNNYTGCVGGCDNELLEILNIPRRTSREPLRIVGSNDSGFESNTLGNTGHEATQRLPRDQPTQQPSWNRGNPSVSTGHEATQQPSWNRGNLSVSTGHEATQRPWGNQSSDTRPVATQQPPWNRGNTSINTRHEDMGPPRNDPHGVMCKCNKPAVKLVTKKQGPNLGREFYKCDVQQGANGCNFFQWADEVATNQIQHRQVQNTATVDETDNNCYCAVPSRLFTVQKEGPNIGRQFYGCSKPMNDPQRCRFFKWTDETNRDENITRYNQFDNGNRPTWNNNNKKRKANTTDQQSKRRKCSVCGQEGHNRKNCPQT